MISFASQIETIGGPTSESEEGTPVNKNKKTSESEGLKDFEGATIENWSEIALGPLKDYLIFRGD